MWGRTNRLSVVAPETTAIPRLGFTKQNYQSLPDIRMIPKISKLDDPRVKKKLHQINSQHSQQLKLIKLNYEQEVKND